MKKVYRQKEPGIPFTREGYRKVLDQQVKLKAERPDAVENLRKAREMGDLSENGYYHASKGRLSTLDSRLRHLKKLLLLGRIVENQGKISLKQLSEKLRREVTIKTVKINPFMLSLRIQGFAIREPRSTKPFVSFDELYLNFQSMSIFKRGIIIKEIRLEKTYLNLVRDEDHLLGGRHVRREEERAG